MEFNQQNFAEALTRLKDTARLQGNMLTRVQISEEFEGWEPDGKQLALIEDYFRNNHIGIDEPSDAQEYLSGEDKSFLDMFLEELEQLPVLSDGEKRAMMMSALANDKAAQEKLVEIYLPDVVEISKLYAGQGVLVEDLIGEGNVALSAAVNMLDCVEGIDEVEGFLVRMVMNAMEECIGDDSDSRQAHENVLNRVNEVNDKAKEIYDNLIRKVSVKEVADELGVDESKVREAVKLSADHIDYIEGAADAE